jgi:hypothetical protein
MLSIDDPRLGTLVFRKKEQQSSVNLESETVILQFVTGIYSTLNETGTFIWESLNSPASFDHIKDMIVDKYEVDEEKCSRDLFSFLKHLEDNDLVTHGE